MTIHEFRTIIDRIDDSLSDVAKHEKLVTVRVSGENGIGSIPSSEVVHVLNGFDWDGWQIILYTKDRLYKN